MRGGGGGGATVLVALTWKAVNKSDTKKIHPSQPTHWRIDKRKKEEEEAEAIPSLFRRPTCLPAIMQQILLGLLTDVSFPQL